MWKGNAVTNKKNHTLYDWLSDFVGELENPEKPTHWDFEKQAYADGCYDTQLMIVKRLKRALRAEKVNMERYKNE